MPGAPRKLHAPALRQVGVIVNQLPAQIQQHPVPIGQDAAVPVVTGKLLGDPLRAVRQEGDQVIFSRFLPVAVIAAQGKPAPGKAAGPGPVIHRQPLLQQPLPPAGAEVIAASVQEELIPIQENSLRHVLSPEIHGIPQCPVLREEPGPIVVPKIRAASILFRDRDRLVQQHQENALPLQGGLHRAGELPLEKFPQLPLPDGPDRLPVAVLPVVGVACFLAEQEAGRDVVEVPLLLVQEGQLGGVPDLFLYRLPGQVVPEVVRLRRLGVRQEFPVHPEGAAQDAF